MEDHRILYRQSMDRIMMELFSVLKAQTMFLATDVMLRKWFSYTKVIVQRILDRR